MEVDSTFYGTPAPNRLLRWARAVPPDFTFALKLAREITHERRLIDCAALAAAFFDAARHLGGQLEAVLVQLPPDFGVAEWPALEAFIALLPADLPIALELRDPHWFAPPLRPQLAGILRDRRIALAVSDGPFVELNIMLAALVAPTAPFAYIRWLGRRDSVARFDRATIDRSAHIVRWAAAIASVAGRLQRICGYANNQYMGHSPATIRAIYQELGVTRAVPPVYPQMELFS